MKTKRIAGMAATALARCSIQLKFKALPSFVHRKYNSSTKSCSQIIKSPSLTSLDLPDVWTLNPTPSQFHPLPAQIQANKQTAAVIDGKTMAEDIRIHIASEVTRMKESIQKVPGLAVILVGRRRDSQTYVRKKVMACEEVGIKSLLTELPDNCTEKDILCALSNYNENPSVHGILVQLPLPQHLNEEKILGAVSVQKDVDGLHPQNIGDLAMWKREPLFISCAPKGCIELLLRSGVEIMGKNAVVIGRSNIVGLPMSLLLQRHHATVSVVNVFTTNPEEVAREADILITAVGVPNLIHGNWIKPGAVVIDVGTFPVEDLRSEDGYRLQGDVCFDEAVSVASVITPVPGGVGPMTVAMLLSNTLDAAKRAYDFS